MILKGTVTEEHVRAVNDSVKKAFRERPSMFAHEVLICEAKRLRAIIGKGKTGNGESKCLKEL